MKKITTALLSLPFCFQSCSSDGGSAEAVLVEAFDITIELPEHPETTQKLARVQGDNLEGATFNLVSQDPRGGMSVDPNTGEIMVLDSTVFDYEINPILTATLTVNNQVSSDEFNIEVTLTDIDDIEFSLTDSKDAYKNAERGSWVLITEEEYEVLANSLIEITRIGTTKEEYDAAGETISSSEDFTFAHNSAQIPEGGFVFAFKYDNASPLSEKSKLKFTTDVQRGYEDFASILPSHGAGENFFLLKGNEMSFESEGYLGFYNENSIRLIRTEGLDTRFYFGFGDTSTMEQNYGNYIARYQGLSSTIKQWN